MNESATEQVQKNMARLGVSHREARADCQCSELIDRIAAGAPIGKLLFIESLGHVRVPFARDLPDHRAGIELATIDAHRAAEAAPDIKGRLDNRVAGEARQDRFEIGDFPGRAAAGHSVSFSLVKCDNLQPMWDQTILPASVLPPISGSRTSGRAIWLGLNLINCRGNLSR
jgi:hypothetical protein